MRKIAMTEFKVQRGEFKFKYMNHQIIDKSIEWVSDDEGYITIYENPKKNTPYVIGADTAGEGSDYNTGICTNNITGCDVASIRVQFDEDLHARQLYCLGKWYGQLNHCANNALMGVEINFSTHPHKEIERMGYDNIYMREPAQDSFSGEMVKKSGFKTTKATRQHALDMLRTIVREEPEKIRDLTLLDEMLTFVKNEKGKPVAMVGKNDDMVMARAINCYVAGQQLESELETFEYIDLSNLPQDMIDDYLRAAENERHIILHNWRQEGVV
jgi:phage terminase large subunit